MLVVEMKLIDKDIFIWVVELRSEFQKLGFHQVFNRVT